MISTSGRDHKTAVNSGYWLSDATQTLLCVSSSLKRVDYGIKWDLF